MTVADSMRAKLEAALAPTSLELVDQSDQHIGHAGHREEGESHFQLKIVSSAFAGQSRVARQRTVYAILAEEMAGRVHALAMTTLTPEEERAS